jgi:PIN like domain
VILIDRSIPRSVAEGLKQVRSDVTWLEDIFRHDEKDAVWLKQAGNEGWMVILRDKKIRTRRGERDAIVESKVGCFILNQGKDPTRWECLKLLALTLDEMERIYGVEPRPFIYTVSREGRMTSVLR